MNFYNKQGKPIAYLTGEGDIYLFSGKPVAYLSDEAVYGFNGKHLGWFVDGWLVDLYGKRVFFTDNATGGPSKPIKQISPIKSIKSIKPIKSIKEIRTIKAVLSSSWSSISDKTFFDK